MRPKKDGLEDFLRLTPEIKKQLVSLISDYCNVLNKEFTAGSVEITLRSYKICKAFINDAKAHGREWGGLLATLNICNFWSILRNNRVRRRAENAGSDACSVACPIVMRYVLDHLIVLTDRFFIQAPSNRVMIPATIGTAMYKLLKHCRVRAYTYSKVLGVDRAAILASGRQVVEHMMRMEKEGLLSSKFKAFCKWVFTYPVLDEMFQTMVSSKTGQLTDDVKDVRALIKTLPRASYSSHAGQRSYVSAVLPTCLLSTKPKAVDTPILVSGSEGLEEELMGGDGGASHAEACRAEGGQFHDFTDELESPPGLDMPLDPEAGGADGDSSSSGSDTGNSDTDQSDREEVGTEAPRLGGAKSRKPSRPQGKALRLSHPSSSVAEAEMLTHETDERPIFPHPSKPTFLPPVKRKKGRWDGWEGMFLPRTETDSATPDMADGRETRKPKRIRPFHPPGSPWANQPLSASLALAPVPTSEAARCLLPPHVPRPCDQMPVETPEAGTGVEDPDEETSQAVKALREMVDTAIPQKEEAAQRGQMALDHTPPCGHLDELATTLETMTEDLNLDSPLTPELNEILDTFLNDECLLHAMHLSTGLSIFDTSLF
ncbi:BRLF1 [macacine gammaherpesvirus 10]|uniref:BRLF1 n=1 Tax=macacine gammaherpesvirus 10 TaxID=2560569 RepID=A0A0S0DIY2_9GAMA|nr:BRLF1 [macacine gammaherpesvirus 10]ALF03236.1 BRLF1 [macacine gammaherpesvirus 10]